MKRPLLDRYTPTLLVPEPFQSPVMGMSPGMPPNAKTRSSALNCRLPSKSSNHKKPLRKIPTLLGVVEEDITETDLRNATNDWSCAALLRSEERRVGKECRSRWS